MIYYNSIALSLIIILNKSVNKKMKNILNQNKSKYGLLTVVGMSLLYFQNGNNMVMADEGEAEEFVALLVYNTLTPKVY